VIAAGKDYLFALKDEGRTMCKLAEEVLPGVIGSGPWPLP
jgi:hypothetical protein